MPKLSLDDLKLRNRTVLMRVDFNVPLDADRHITDDLRIRAALPSIQKVLAEGGKLILCSHLGRPKGKPDTQYSLRPVADHLASLLKQEVRFAPDCVGKETAKLKSALQPGEVLLLENLRFHPGETANDADFSRELAEHCDVYVNDAFGTAHRAHASTEGVTYFFDQCAAGYLMQKELRFLGDALTDPQRPFVAILGGAKISGKIDVIQNLLGKTDSLLIGGGMIFTFFKAHGWGIGKSLLEEDRLDMAREILRRAQESTTRLEFPTDVLVADRFEAGARTHTVGADNIPEQEIGVDIGSATIEKFRQVLSKARTIVWNGPMGVFEIPDFARGTEAIARCLAERTAAGAMTIVGGGDSAAAVKQLGLEEQITHVSTGGGASLEFLEGKALPGVMALTDK